MADSDSVGGVSSRNRPSQHHTTGVMATPRACQCFKFTGKIRTMFNQINPHHFSCLYKMTFERHAVKALRSCDDLHTERPRRRLAGGGDGGAEWETATAGGSSSDAEDDLSPPSTPEGAFRPRSFTVGVFDTLQLNAGLLSDANTDARCDLTPWVICKQSHLAYKSNRGAGTSPGPGTVDSVTLPVTRRNSDRYLASRAATDGASTPSPGKRHRPCSKRFVYVTSGRRSPVVKPPASDAVFKIGLTQLPPTSDAGISTPDSGDQMREANAKGEMRLPVMAPDMAARRIGSAGEGHHDKPTRHCWVLPSRQTSFLYRSGAFSGRAASRDGLQTQAKPPRSTPSRRTNTDSARNGGSSR